MDEGRSQRADRASHSASAGEEHYLAVSLTERFFAPTFQTLILKRRDLRKTSPCLKPFTNGSSNNGLVPPQLRTAASC
jgi:hypothetical protein